MAAGILHDVVEDTETLRRPTWRTPSEPQVAGLVAGVTEDELIAGYRRAKGGAARAGRRRAGEGSAWIYAADKVAKVRELRARIRTAASPDEDYAPRLDHYRESLAMLEGRLPGNPLVTQLRFELELLAALPPDTPFAIVRRLTYLPLLLLLLLPAAARAATPLSRCVDTRMGTERGRRRLRHRRRRRRRRTRARSRRSAWSSSAPTRRPTPQLRRRLHLQRHAVRGFSLTHVCGAGCAALGDVPILPTTAPWTRRRRRSRSYDVNAALRRTSFTHRRRGRPTRRLPGAQLGNGIAAELTATPRTGDAADDVPGRLARLGARSTPAAARWATPTRPARRPGAPGDQRHGRQRGVLLRRATATRPLRRPLRPRRSPARARGRSSC